MTGDGKSNRTRGVWCALSGHWFGGVRGTVPRVCDTCGASEPPPKGTVWAGGDQK